MGDESVSLISVMFYMSLLGSKTVCAGLDDALHVRFVWLGDLVGCSLIPLQSSGCC